MAAMHRGKMTRRQLEDQHRVQMAAIHRGKATRKQLDDQHGAVTKVATHCKGCLQALQTSTRLRRKWRQFIGVMRLGSSSLESKEPAATDFKSGWRYGGGVVHEHARSPQLRDAQDRRQARLARMTIRCMLDSATSMICSLGSNKQNQSQDRHHSSD